VDGLAKADPSPPAAAPGATRPLALRLLGSVEEVIACAALVIVVAAVAWGVITRYLLAQPAPWTGEIAGMAFAWVVFAGAAAGFKRRLHVSIDLLTRRLPRTLGMLLGRMFELALLLFALYVVWLGVEFTWRNWDNPSPVLRLPLSITYASVTFGFAMIALRQAIWLLRPPAAADATP
jgi:TRAP-type transport system small permease protein